MPTSSIVKDYLVSGSDLLTIYRQWIYYHEIVKGGSESNGTNIICDL